MVDAAVATPAGDAAHGASGANGDSTRGRPYYEKLRKDLRQTLERKRELDKTMSTLEGTIARLETQYLEETSAAGNIIKGFDNYIKSSTTGASIASASTGTATRRKGGISEHDRIFSRSSLSWTMRDSPAPVLMMNSGASGTTSAAATPTAGSGSNAHSGAVSTPGSTAGGTSKAGKKKKAAVEKEEAEERPAKRGKVSWGRD